MLLIISSQKYQAIILVMMINFKEEILRKIFLEVLKSFRLSLDKCE